MISTSIVAYIVLFVVAGAAFLFGALLFGWFLRPKMPTREKLATYECGEPAIGTSRVRFDLRFYVVALLFIVFEVEVAFFFPWAAVFGSATKLMDPDTPKAVKVVWPEEGSSIGVPNLPEPVRDQLVMLDPFEAGPTLKRLGISKPELPGLGENVEEYNAKIESDMRRLAMMAMVDIAVFFAVLMVGFVYVWYRGDLDWVKAYRASNVAE